ncbi:hypothetical protein LP7551_00358 [Roseibium album]|nr:hypothetical protein LP7551_00358 [Roseibium album]
MAYEVSQTSNTRYSPIFEWVGENYYFQDAPYQVPPGNPITVEGFPRALKIVSAHKTLPDFFLLSGKYAVSDRMKDVLEKLEPGVHQYIPVILQKKSGEPFEGEFFVLHPCSAVDAIVPEQSDVSFHTTPAGRITMRFKKVRPKLTVQKEKIKDRHFWTGDESFNRNFFSSNAFFDEAQKAKLKGFDFIPMTEI